MNTILAGICTAYFGTMLLTLALAIGATILADHMMWGWWDDTAKVLWTILVAEIFAVVLVLAGALIHGGVSMLLNP